jgi:myo-inositol-1(or 4)-monophosphatase
VTPSLTSLFETTRDALLAGGKIVKAGFHKAKSVHYKTATSPVTQVDLASEKAIISLISKRFQDHTFLAEETAPVVAHNAHRSGRSVYRWIIDPLDGTVNFIHGIPQTSISIGVEKDGRVLAGGVFDPFRDELFLAAKGRGATLNARRIKVSSETVPLKSLMITGFPYDHQKNAQKHADFLVPFLASMADLRRFGSAAIDLSWIACGRADAYFEFNLNPWDVAAGWLLVEEAGGKVTDFKGNRLDIEKPHQTVATNRRLHAKILKKFLIGS